MVFFDDGAAFSLSNRALSLPVVVVVVVVGVLVVVVVVLGVLVVLGASLETVANKPKQHSFTAFLFYLNRSFLPNRMKTEPSPRLLVEFRFPFDELELEMGSDSSFCR